MKDTCNKFKLNPDLNPEDDTPIDVKTFKKFLRECKSKRMSNENCVFFNKTSINPLTNRKLSSPKSIEKIKSKCDKLYGEVKKGCVSIIKSGLRKGKRCGRKTEKGENICKLHKRFSGEKPQIKQKSPIKKSPYLVPEKPKSPSMNKLLKLREDVQHLDDTMDMVENLSNYQDWMKEYSSVKNQIKELSEKNIKQEKQELLDILGKLKKKIRNTNVVKEILKYNKDVLSKRQKIIKILNKFVDIYEQLEKNGINEYIKKKFIRLVEKIQKIFSKPKYQELAKEFLPDFEELTNKIDDFVIDFEYKLKSEMDSILKNYNLLKKKIESVSTKQEFDNLKKVEMRKLLKEIEDFKTNLPDIYEEENQEISSLLTELTSIINQKSEHLQQTKPSRKKNILTQFE